MPLRLIRPASLLLCLVIASCTGGEAPAPMAINQPPFNQLEVSGNACGPAALLNSFRYGNSGWHSLVESMPGTNDRERLSYTIRAYGLRPSGQLQGRTRWSRAGINVSDLTDLGNDLAATRLLPKLHAEVLSPSTSESSGYPDVPDL
ncbi:MAG: hypothetical protein QM755_11730 [Luteolibacter sp.]